jgi:hypothetical protein
MKTHRYITGLFLLIMLDALITSAAGQEKNTAVDSVKVPLGYQVVFRDTVLRFSKDTLLVLPRGSNYKIKKDKEFHSAAFYDSMRVKSSNNRLVQGLYETMVRKQPDSISGNTPQNNENYHPEYVNKRIGKINIQTVDIIHGNLYDTSAQAVRGYSAMLNKLHRDTWTSIIRKNLTVHEGDMLGAYTVSDNEYYLRSLSYIEDVRIIVTVDSLHPDVANLLVITKDVFPLTLGLSMGSFSDYTVEVNDINIAGTGHELRNRLRYKAGSSHPFGYTGELSFKNISGSFVDAYLLYRNNELEDLYRLTLKREFITPETKYGGGIELFQLKTSANVEVSDSVTVSVPYTKNYFDQWIGRVFLLNTVTRRSIVLKTRYMITRYTQRPQVEADTNQQFYNADLLLGSVTLLRRNHYKENMLLGFGLVEDVDFGTAVELTFGYHFGEFLDAPYLGLSYKTAHKIGLGYLGGGIEYGGYLYQDKITQGLLRTAVTYYSPLFDIGRTHYRFLCRANYTEGIRRYPYEILSIGKEIRGMSKSGIEGDRRLALRVELVGFLNASLLGFKFSPNVFYDAAFVNTGTTLLSAGSFYSGLGFGVRIRNENLAFRTIIIRLAYYPDNPVKDGHFGLGFTTSNPDVIRDYEIVKPDVLKY